MTTLSTSFEQLKEIATLEELTSLSEQYTIDSAFESLCERCDILDENIENLQALREIVEKGAVSPALEAFCGENFKKTFGVDDISLESLTIAGVALVIWCILAIVAIIEFFMMVWSMIFGGKGGGGGRGTVTVTLKRTAKSILAETLKKYEDDIVKYIKAGHIPTDAEIDQALSVQSGTEVEGVVIPQDIINDANKRIMDARERIKRVANETQDKANSNIAREIGKEIRASVQDSYKTLARLPVRVHGDGIESANTDHTGDIDLVQDSAGDISVVSPRVIRRWIKKITDFVGSGISSNIVEVTRDLISLKSTVATCIENLGKAEEYINNGTYNVPPIDNINEFWRNKDRRTEYFKNVPSTMANLLLESVNLAVIDTESNRQFVHSKESILTLYEKNRSFYVKLFDDLRNGFRVDNLFSEIAEETSKKIMAALQPAADIRNAENKADELIKRMRSVLASTENIWSDALGDTSWTFDAEMTELRSTNERTKGTLDNIHNEFKTLADRLQASSDKMRQNYPKNPGGFRKICEIVMTELGNTATESREHITTILGFLSGYLRVADNVTKSYTEAMNTALNALIQGSKSTEDKYIRLILTTIAASAPVPQHS